MRILCLLVVIAIASQSVYSAEVKFDDSQTGKVLITHDGEEVAEYVYQDPEIPRPYFSGVHAPGRVQVTRTHPPNPKQDVADHPYFHPGIWLSFGDLGGSDYWRNVARVVFVDFSEVPHSTKDGGQFTARFRYLDQVEPSKIACQEEFRCQILPRPAGTLIVWDSTFTSDHEFTFGDQEEMGLGIRMATPLRSESQKRGEIAAGTGTILDAEGRKNGAEVWGNSAQWCDYSGTIDDQHVGATFFCHPQNFRASWFHARDYGLLVANPFGQKAFHHGDSSSFTVKSGEKFRLRYGILLHSGSETDLNVAYQDYVTLTTAREETDRP